MPPAGTGPDCAARHSELLGADGWRFQLQQPARLLNTKVFRNSAIPHGTSSIKMPDHAYPNPEHTSQLPPLPWPPKRPASPSFCRTGECVWPTSESSPSCATAVRASIVDLFAASPRHEAGRVFLNQETVAVKVCLGPFSVHVVQQNKQAEKKFSLYKASDSQSPPAAAFLARGGTGAPFAC